MADDHQILLHAEATIHTEHRCVLADQCELGLRQYVLLGHIHLAYDLLANKNKYNYND